MNLTVLLADAAQVDSRNKVHALGMGWTHTQAPSPPMAVVAFVELDPSELPFDLKFHLELHDSNKTPVTMLTPEGSRPVVVDAEVHGSPRDESREGEPLIVPIVAQFGPGVITTPGSYSVHVTTTRQKSGEAVQATRDFLVFEPEQNVAAAMV